MSRNPLVEIPAAILGLLLLAFAIGFAIAVPKEAPVPEYNIAPPGMVMGAADITLDGGDTRQYRLAIRAFDDGFPYIVRVDKETYDFYTEQLGRTWPR